MTNMSHITELCMELVQFVQIYNISGATLSGECGATGASRGLELRVSCQILPGC